jgi:hypothetical protein
MLNLPPLLSACLLLPCSLGDARAMLREMKLKSGEGRGGALGVLPTRPPAAPVPLPRWSARPPHTQSPRARLRPLDILCRAPPCR